MLVFERGKSPFLTPKKVGRTRSIIVLTVAIWSLLCVVTPVDACSPGCTCTTLKPKDGKNGEAGLISRGRVRGRKVNCADHLAPITTVDQINSLPLDTVILDLSKNAITVLRRGAFNRWSMLKRLDLSDNKISFIEPGAFQGLRNLEKLDLSDNKIGTVNSSMFTGMPKLQKLSLSNNRVNTIPEGTFNYLTSLRKIEFKSDLLRCDCHLQWIAKWSKEKNIRIQQSTTCAVPRELKDRPLKSLKKKDLHCDRPLELPLFEISPSRSQVVFEGDKIPFECRASIIDENTKMVWLRKGDVVESNRSAGIIIHTSREGSMMTHQLVLENLNKQDMGVWQCMVTTPRGNVSDDINIVVISSSAVYCSPLTSRTTKGVYRWPKTVAGVRSELPCKQNEERIATHDCNSKGHWKNINLSQCYFTSQTRRRLQELAESLTSRVSAANISTVYKAARNLQLLVLDPVRLPKPEDLSLAATAVMGLATFISAKEEIADTVLKIVSSLLRLSPSFFIDEQKAEKTCTKLIKMVEDIPKQLNFEPKNPIYSESISLEAMKVNTEDFTGMTCFAYPTICSCQAGTINQTSPRFLRQKNLQGSILIPNTLLNNTLDSGEIRNQSLNLQFILYKAAKLFPSTSSKHEDSRLNNNKLRVVSSVLSANVSVTATNLSDPVILTFRVSIPLQRQVAAYWDFDANDGLGDWRTDGCNIVSQIDNVTVVHCYHLSIFAILEANKTNGRDALGMSRMLHLLPYPVYVGSCICLLCLMAVIITYVSCFRFINVPKKMKHSVINICISVLLLIIAFTMGVKRTDHHFACQIVGVAIHYLVLVAMFWITITSYNMLKKFVKADRPPSPPPEPVAMPLPPKPMLRFYLLAWGVPIIVCGITVAVSIDHYSEPNYCFLAWDPSLGAFYAPVGLLTVFNLIFFLRISRVIYSSVNNLNESDNTEEVNDIELTQSPDDTNTEIQALTNTRPTTDDDTESVASSVMDQEKRPISQLYAVVAILFLFILFCTCGAFAVAEPFKTIIPHQELIFSYLYGLTSSVFGIFMLVYFCLTRKDSCSSWRRFFLCEQQPVFDVNYHGANNHVGLSNGHVVRSNSDTDMSNKNYNITQDMNDGGTVKQNNINLIPAPGFLTDSSATGGTEQNNMPTFYNPKQNGIAKKFWERQRHHSKLITKEMTKDFNGSGSEYFSGSEVNHRGNASDANTHLSIEIQIQPNNIHPMIGGSNPTTISPGPQSLYPNQLILPAIQGVSGPIPKFSMLPLDRNHIPPVGGSVSPEPATTSPCCSTVSYSGSVPPHVRSPSSCSLGVRTHPSAFTPVAPRNNTLPKQSKNPQCPNDENANTTSQTQANDYVIRNGSVPRLRDFDGQSQVSETCPREHWNVPVTSNYLNNNRKDHVMQTFDPSSCQSPVNGCTYKQYGSVDDHITSDQSVPYTHYTRARSSSGGYSSDASGRLHRKRDQAFLQEVHQRIPCDSSKSPQPKEAQSPVSNPDTSQLNKLFTMHDSDSQLHLKRNRGNDSDHNSEPTSQASHRRKHRSHGSHDSHRHSRHSKGSSRHHHHTTADWNTDNQRPKVIPYAYVNHNYHERVRQKLQKNAAVQNVKQYPPDLMEDSSSSTDDDEGLDDIWVMQHQKKQKNKKETSV